MSVLRRPDDRRRNLRRRAPRAFFSADPHQDRHLMIAIAALPTAQRRSSSPPAARRSRKALSSQRPQTLSARRAHIRRSYARDRQSSSPSFPPRTMGATSPPKPHERSVRDPKIPIGRAQPNRAPSCPRFPPCEAFGRRPRAQPSAPAKGRRPKLFSRGDVSNRRILLKNSEIEPSRKSCFRARRVISADSPHRRVYRSLARGKTDRSADPLRNFSSRPPAVFLNCDRCGNSSFSTLST
jgi:hypothetical protein